MACSRRGIAIQALALLFACFSGSVVEALGCKVEAGALGSRVQVVWLWPLGWALGLEGVSFQRLSLGFGVVEFRWGFGFQLGSPPAGAALPDLTPT